MRHLLNRIRSAGAVPLGILMFPALMAAAVLQTPVQLADLDPAATADWTAGVLRTNPAFGSYAPGNRPEGVLFTQTTKPTSGWAYGISNVAGLRHVRIGFKRPIPTGTVLTLGDSSLSVLAPGAVYPGDPGNEADWIPAQRLVGRSLATNAPTISECVTWVLPPDVTTRALRFSHRSDSWNPSYQGTILGAYVLTERFSNLAPQAIAITTSNVSRAPLLNNGFINGAWDNGGVATSPVISTNFPQDILLVWPTNVTSAGLCVLHAAFSEAEVFRYTGPADRHPREASETNWVRIGSYTNIQYQVPRRLTPNWLEFETEISSRAIRLRITKAVNPAIDTYFNAQNGSRVGLDEVAVLTPLNDRSLESSVIPLPASVPPPIPVLFTLSAPGIVTLVIDDAAGKRVRNLISETPFPAGSNVVWWDGLDESGRVNTGSHGSYEVQGSLVSPGTYRSRGLVRDALKLRYEFTVGTAGNPPWRVAGATSGGWLADHRPPSDVLYLPGTNAQMLIASEVAEAGEGLVWTDLNGNKLKGRTSLAPGGFYTASHLAIERGTSAVPGVMAYAGYTDGSTMTFMGISAAGSPTAIASISFTNAGVMLTGLAARDGLLFASIGGLNQLRVLDTRTAKFLATNSISDPRGLAFGSADDLWLLSSNRMLRCQANLSNGTLGTPSVIIPTGLDDPRKLALDGAGNCYISQWGNSHNVAVFNPQGVLLRRIGVPGLPAAGPYDPNHMNYPNGLAIAGDGRLWVAESDHAPKRVSIWNTNGQLEKALYGPPKYGGGGQLDPLDKTRFYYGDYDDNDIIPYFIGLEYKLDWNSGSNYLSHVYYRTGTNGFFLPFAGPETAIYVAGRQYMVNALNASPTAGASVAGIWQMRNAVAQPVAAVGNSDRWRWLARPEFVPRLPPGGSLNNTIFAWSDLNDDGIASANEVTFKVASGASFIVSEGLSVVSGRALNLEPRGFTAAGAPIYDLADAVVLMPGVVPLGSSGGGQFFPSKNGYHVLTGGPMVGYRNGQAEWSYPSQWPTLHASQSAPVPSYPGQLIGTTRLLGLPVSVAGGEAGEIWAVNGNLGNAYLFTVDGLFISTLFRDIRTAPAWSMPQATRGMLLNDVSLYDECFWPTISGTSDGQVYLCAGKTHSSLVRLEGLETIRRLPVTAMTVSTQQLIAAADWLIEREAERHATAGRGTLQVATFSTAPQIDGNLNEWTGNWVGIDERVQAAVAVGQKTLYVAFKTGDNGLLLNTGDPPELSFATGGALDIMIGTTRLDADPQRSSPVDGDLRLVISLASGRTLAMLYRPVFSGTSNPFTFSSPLRTIAFDRVDDVSASVTLGREATGDYELAIPFAALGINPVPGQLILGDVGVLRGSGSDTVQRVYWQNKATALVSDIPSEAELTPALWGRWQFGGSPVQPPANLRVGPAEL